MCSAMDYHHSFRAFRAQSLNLINVAVHISETNQSLIRVVVVKIQRSRFGCSQNGERWLLIAEHAGLGGFMRNRIYKISRAACCE